MMRFFRLSVVLLAAVLWLPVPAAGQLQPLSEVFPVAWPVPEPGNPYTGPYTSLPGLPLAAAARHGFVVASLSSTGHRDAVVDGSLVDLSGQPGPRFLATFVSNESDAILDDPALAATGSDGFVLVWASLPWSLRFRRFGPGGASLGDVSDLNVSENKWSLLNPAVAGNAAGGFVAAWEGCGSGLCARAFDPAGKPATAELKVLLPGASGPAAMPRVGIDAAGRFVVLWRQAGTTEAVPARLCGQAYGVRGGFLGNSFCTGELAGSTGGAVAVDPAGSFLVAWFDPAAEGAPVPLFVRRYQMNGIPLGSPVQVAAATDPSHLAASADGHGNAALSWLEGDRMRILLIRRDAVAKGPAITISRVESYPEVYANSVALSDSGRLLITWRSGQVVLGQLWQARF
jgi:hypothetical protein